MMNEPTLSTQQRASKSDHESRCSACLEPPFLTENKVKQCKFTENGSRPHQQPWHFRKGHPFFLQVERILEGGLGPFVNQAINEFLGAAPLGVLKGFEFQQIQGITTSHNLSYHGV